MFRNVSKCFENFGKNMEIEFRRNCERYEFLKWGTQAFNNFNVYPPGVGIVHQVNLAQYFFYLFGQVSPFLSGL